jgi:hypothetical protein
MASTCPDCGGRERVQITATGYWECRSSRLAGMQGHGNRQTPIFETCLHRYQDTSNLAPSQICSCRTLAVGICAKCGFPVCEDCPDYQGVRLCHDCLIAARKAEREASAHERKIQMEKEQEERLGRLRMLETAVGPARSSLAKRRVRTVRVAELATRSFHSSGGMNGHGRETREPYFYIRKELGDGWLVMPGVVLLADGGLRRCGRESILTSVHPYGRWNSKRELRLAADEPIDLCVYAGSEAPSEAESLISSLNSMADGGDAAPIIPDPVVWSPRGTRPAGARDYRGWYMWLLVIPGFYPGLVSLLGQSIHGFEPAGLIDAMYIILPATLIFVLIMAMTRSKSRT